MRGTTGGLRRDLQFASVCTLGAASAAWVLAVEPGWLAPAPLGFALIGALLGSARLPLPRLGAVPIAPGIVVAALLRHGLATAVLTALLATWVDALASPRVGARAVSTATFRLSAAALGTTIGGLVFVALLQGRSDPYRVLPVTGFLLVWIAGRRILDALGDPLGGTLRHFCWRSWARSAARLAVATLLGWAVVSIEVLTGDARTLVVWPFATLVLQAARKRTARARGRRNRPSESAYRALSHVLASGLAQQDDTLQSRLRRLQRLAVGVGRRLDLAQDDLAALSAGALLHEIGRFGVSADLLWRAGPMPAEEAERIRVHPHVGVEMLDAISFPFPVSSVVRHYHERWDGTGYPDGMAGSRIPIGARILSVVERYESLTRDGAQGARPPRFALDQLRREAGGAFDPEVIEALADHLQAGRRVGPSEPACDADPSVEPSVERSGLRAAQRDLLTLYEIERAAGYGLDLAENLGIIAGKLQSLISHEALVVYLVDDELPLLRPVFVQGRCADELRDVRIPIGERLSGRAAVDLRATAGYRKSLIDAGWDFERTDASPRIDALRAALVAPLVRRDRCVGVLALYDSAARRFADEERRTIVAAAGRVALAVGRVDPRDPGYFESLTDPATGLPNARYLEISAADLGNFGLLAFRLAGIDGLSEASGVETADRLLGIVGRRLATACRAGEFPVRFGADLFLVLCPAGDPHQLVDRWDSLLRAVEGDPVEIAVNRSWRVRLLSARASYPADGATLDELLALLGSRLSHDTGVGSRVVPFRCAGSAS